MTNARFIAMWKGTKRESTQFEASGIFLFKHNWLTASAFIFWEKNQKIFQQGANQ